MKVVVDRLVQYPNRFQLVNVSTSEVLGVFDLSAVTGTIQQVGTEIDAELFQSIQDDLTQLAQNIVEESNARGVDVNALQTSIATKITANGGELGNAVVTFTEVSNAPNIASGEKASILFGKIKNWFSRLRALAFKDTIADADISASANISQSKVSGLTAIKNKIDGIDVGANKYTLPVSTATNLGGVKVGSRLSVATDGTLSADSQTENSYTTTEKNKLAGIEIGAQKNAVTSVAGKTGAVTLDKSNVGLGNVDNVKQYSASNPPPVATQSANGLMSMTDKTILDNIPNNYIGKTGKQEIEYGGAGGSNVVFHDSEWDSVVVKNKADANRKTILSSDYLWQQLSADDVIRLNALNILGFNASAPNGWTLNYPSIPNGETRTIATQEELSGFVKRNMIGFGLSTGRWGITQDGFLAVLAYIPIPSSINVNAGTITRNDFHNLLLSVYPNGGSFIINGIWNRGGVVYQPYMLIVNPYTQKVYMCAVTHDSSVSMGNRDLMVDMTNFDYNVLVQIYPI